MTNAKWDFFLSHATEDKPFARKLKNKLTARGFKVWFDESTLTIGDSLLESIENGLIKSKYGIIILSPYFFNKHWTKKELNGLFQKEIGTKTKLILPILHNLSIEEVRNHSLILADKLSYSSNLKINKLVDFIIKGSGLIESEIISVPEDWFGELFLRPGPDKPRFVKVGDIIEKDADIGFIVKRTDFFEPPMIGIHAPFKCRVLEILCDTKDYDYVEENDPLFSIQKLYD